NMSLPGYTGARISGFWSMRARSGSGEDSLDRLLPGPPIIAVRRKSTSQTKTEVLRTCTHTIYTAGRPPWYDEHGAESKEAFVIGLCGGSASGKTTVANKIIEALDVPWVVLLSMDSFYKVRPVSNDYSFDHPGQRLKHGKIVMIPVYDFTTHGRQKDWKTVYGASVVIFEGIMSFADKELLELRDMKSIVDTDSDIRHVRRLRRDITERGRDIEGVIKQYNKFVKPAFERYIEPYIQLADIVVPRVGEQNSLLSLSPIQMYSPLCCFVQGSPVLGPADSAPPPSQTLRVLESMPQVKGLHTIIRNQETSRDEFVFYPKRLMRLLIEHALTFLPSQPCTVQTPQGREYEGKRSLSGKGITGVSILAACKDVRFGEILIQTNLDSGEPELHYLRLPKGISEEHVILMDSTVSSSAAAMMAVRDLLDHKVQEKIALASLLMAGLGVHWVAYAFPKVKIITTAVDKGVDDFLQAIPGIGDFGDLYFGTDGRTSGWSDDEEQEQPKQQTMNLIL
uniref:uridine/cytidine kinase n=1 Tax=Oncorhynchus kisutch TaxID=8019 RepID=A0A8C7MXN7_ONCKI